MSRRLATPSHLQGTPMPHRRPPHTRRTLSRIVWGVEREIRVALTTNDKGNDMVDVRIFKTCSSERLFSTPHGVTIPAHLVPQVIEALREVEASSKYSGEAA